MKKNDHSESEELRSEIRQAAAHGAVVEFRPSKDAMIYQLTLRDWSASGLGILVKKDSKISQLLDVGQIFTMAIHLGSARTEPEHVYAEVRNISEPQAGRHPDHYIIGLHIRERLTSAP